MKYRVVVEVEQNGDFIARVPELPGVEGRGLTREEAILRAKQAIGEYLDTLTDHNHQMA